MGGLNAIAGRRPPGEGAGHGVVAFPTVAPGVRGSGTRSLRDFGSFEEAVEHAHAFNRRRTRANIETRLRHAMRQGADGRWTYKFDPTIGSGGLQTDFERLWEQVRQIRCPTLLVRGAESAILSAEGAERFARELPGAERAEVPGAGHSVRGQPAGFLAAVRRSWRVTALGGCPSNHGGCSERSGGCERVLAPPSCGVPSGTPRRSSLRLPLSLPARSLSLAMVTGQTPMSAPVPPRLLFLDVCRGLAVLAMLGANLVNVFLRRPPDILRHNQGDVLRALDLPAPVFQFLIGVSLALFLSNRRAAGRTAGEARRDAYRRFALLVLLGMLLDSAAR